MVKSDLQLQDQLFNFADYTKEIDRNVFRVQPLSIQSYEKHDGTQSDITIERSLNLQIYSRSGYTLLDLIANVGGLRTIMAFVLTQLMGYWNFNSVQNYMVSRLFSYKCEGSARAESKTQ